MNDCPCPLCLAERAPATVATMRLDVQSQTIDHLQSRLDSQARQLVLLSERVEQLARLIARANIRL